MRGQLKTTILNSILNEPLSGSQIIKKIEQDYHWKPSPGSLYPQLEQIEKEGLAKIKEEKNKKIYTITAKGKKQLEKLSKNKKEFLQLLEKSHLLMKEIYGVDSGIDQKVLQQLKEDNINFSDIEKESSQLKKETFRILTSKNYKKNKQKIKEVFKKTIAELKKIK
ncbi:MAG: PadR family transcriptional regulator [Candidatus Woesearchaeota archaeon]